MLTDLINSRIMSAKRNLSSDGVLGSDRESREQLCEQYSPKMRQVFFKDWFVDAHMQERGLLETVAVAVMSGLASLRPRDHRFAFSQLDETRNARSPHDFPHTSQMMRG